MTEIDVNVLSDWLGPEAAIVGLEKSKLANAELMVLARQNGLVVEAKATRRQLAVELVMSKATRIDRPREYLLEMSFDELKRYFSERMVSNSELRLLLDVLGIAPTGKLRGRLSDYAAREISELGMFQRVAKGNTEGRR